MSECAQIKRVTKDMLVDIAALEAESFSSPWSENSLELLIGDNGVGFAAFVDGRLAAYGGMMTVLDEGQITNVATRTGFKRKGFARQIMTSLEEYARDIGISFLSLEVRESNSAAIALYRSCGWKDEGLRKNFYTKPVENALIMTKAL